MRTGYNTPADEYIAKKDISLRISNKIVNKASVYTNTYGEEIVRIEFTDQSHLDIETNRDNNTKVSIRYWEVDLD